MPIYLLLCLAAFAGEDLTNSIGMRLQRIQPGTFAMGSADTPLPEAIVARPHIRSGDFDEKPLHKARVSQPFFMGIHEATRKI